MIIFSNWHNRNVHNLFLQTAIDYDKIVGTLCLRCRRTGDYLHPRGRGVGKSIKKLMGLYEQLLKKEVRDLQDMVTTMEKMDISTGKSYKA